MSWYVLWPLKVLPKSFNSSCIKAHFRLMNEIYSNRISFIFLRILHPVECAIKQRNLWKRNMVKCLNVPSHTFTDTQKAHYQIEFNQPKAKHNFQFQQCNFAQPGHPVWKASWVKVRTHRWKMNIFFPCELPPLLYDKCSLSLVTDIPKKTKWIWQINFAFRSAEMLDAFWYWKLTWSISNGFFNFVGCKMSHKA